MIRIFLFICIIVNVFGQGYRRDTSSYIENISQVLDTVQISSTVLEVSYRRDKFWTGYPSWSYFQKKDSTYYRQQDSTFSDNTKSRLILSRQYLEDAVVVNQFKSPHIKGDYDRHQLIIMDTLAVPISLTINFSVDTSLNKIAVYEMHHKRTYEYMNPFCNRHYEKYGVSYLDFKTVRVREDKRIDMLFHDSGRAKCVIYTHVKNEDTILKKKFFYEDTGSYIIKKVETWLNEVLVDQQNYKAGMQVF